MKFWKTRNLLSYALLPLSWVYEEISVLKERNSRSTAVSIPVICVGNLTLGGAGKTPVVSFLARILQEQGETPHILTRGYIPKRYKPKKRDGKPIFVKKETHNAQEVGDEALLLSKIAPVWVGKDRVLSAHEAIKKGATVLLMDDGLQNPSLQKDIVLIVIDQRQGLGNGLVFPAGPLREKLTKGMNRAHAFIRIGPHKKEEPSMQSNIPTFFAHIKPKEPYFPFSPPPLFKTNSASPQPSQRRPPQFIGFAGIGFPEKFRQTLLEICKKNGGQHDDLLYFFPFPDHHVYQQTELKRLYDLCHAPNTFLLTTEKDWVRLEEKDQKRIGFVPMDLEFQEFQALKSFLAEKLIALRHADRL